MTATAQQSADQLPDVVEAGGRWWSRAEDDQPLGAVIGWELACLLGTPVDADTLALAEPAPELAPVVDLRKATSPVAATEVST